jgi:uncharacterized protein YegL
MKIVLVLDRSGSMEASRDETIDALNEYIGTLQKGKGSKEMTFTQVQFDEYWVEGIGGEMEVFIETVLDDVPVKDVPKFTHKTFVPRGNTPLYDAVGQTIKAVKGKRVLFIIMTDGQENASREYTQKMVFDLVEKKKKKDWTFVFLGANQDAYVAGGAMGISQLNTMNYTQGQEQFAMGVVAGGTLSHTGRGFAASEEFFAEEEEVVGGLKLP